MASETADGGDQEILVRPGSKALALLSIRDLYRSITVRHL